MSDDGLRGLQRAARVRPDDVAAGWGYARALERAGERRAFFAELCRLERLGDATATTAIETWHAPGPGVRWARSSDSWDVDDPALRAGASIDSVERTPGGRLALRLHDRTMLVLAPGETRPAFGEAHVLHLGRRGDDLAYVRSEPGDQLIVRDGDSGRVIEEVALDDAVASALSRGDRPPKHPSPLTAGAPSPWISTSLEIAVVARDLVAGREVWSRRLAIPSGEIATWWRYALGLVVQEPVGQTTVMDMGRGEIDRSARWTEIDPRDGALRWQTEGEPATHAVLTPTAIVLFGPAHTTALERRDGTTRWTTTGQRPGCVGVADDVAYFAYEQVKEETSWGSMDSDDGHDVCVLTLTALELATGAVRLCHAAALPLEAEVLQTVMSVGPSCVDVIVVMRDRPARVVRFADQPGAT